MEITIGFSKKEMNQLLPGSIRRSVNKYMAGEEVPPPALRVGLKIYVGLVKRKLIPAIPIEQRTWFPLCGARAEVIEEVVLV
jgi:hypothetical protein